MQSKGKSFASPSLIIGMLSIGLLAGFVLLQPQRVEGQDLACQSVWNGQAWQCSNIECGAPGTNNCCAPCFPP